MRARSAADVDSPSGCPITLNNHETGCTGQVSQTTALSSFEPDSKRPVPNDSVTAFRTPERRLWALHGRSSERRGPVKACHSVGRNV